MDLPINAPAKPLAWSDGIGMSTKVGRVTREASGGPVVTFTGGGKSINQPHLPGAPSDVPEGDCFGYGEWGAASNIARN